MISRACVQCKIVNSGINKLVINHQQKFNQTMKSIAIICIFATLISMNSAQRGSYSGSRPIDNGVKGSFPDKQNTISNRFGETDITSNANQHVVPLPQHFPVNPNNNINLINQMNSQAADQQLFWFLNRDHISNHLNSPQNYGGTVHANRGSFMGKR